MFLLPKGVIKRFEAICRNYLWDGSPDYHRVPLIAWDKVTLPKLEGGLGIKKADVWNTATVGKLYWKSICKVKETLKSGYQDNKWISDDKEYSIKHGYEWLRFKQPEQEWYQLVWNNWNIPKHALITWIIMNKGLNTKDKLFRIGCCTDDRCSICDISSETQEHLFFECRYSKEILSIVEKWCGFKINVMHGMTGNTGPKLKHNAHTLICATIPFGTKGTMLE
ncbi:uncharacterized protein LOC141651490 [Silene latifolia]|uniref:uncharacterized protein LOC141651490 n=1 Tax=Silene latifolia TaxID=37657 RepID=UPI003D7782A8